MLKLRQSLAIFFLFILVLSGCAQMGRQSPPVEPGALSGEYSAFDMGGVRIRVPLPQGYVEAPAALRQAVEGSLVPAENVFAVSLPAAERGALRGSGAAVLEQRKYLVLSARPEFMREIVDRAFFAAMRRDFARTGGSFAPGRLAQFRALTENYYARDDAFSHNLGVYYDRPEAVGLVRIVRLAGSGGRGAEPAREAPRAEGGSAPNAPGGPWQGWDKAYFARACHQVVIQNVLLLEGRCLNIYFAAPLAAEADLYAAMRENQAYVEALLSRLGGSRGGSPSASFGVLFLRTI